ncbi:hypothetical protein [Pyrobaculum sp.]|uniref:hypothetical protein n=1 Tax=Pyrobaculum sp. TaxID=2004705 RepID=UPI0031645F31
MLNKSLARVAVVLLALAAVAHAADEVFVVNSLLGAFSLINVPDVLLPRYELFHTAHVTQSGITIADSPLIPGGNVTELALLAKALFHDLKQQYDAGQLQIVVNETGIYAYQNGTLAYAMTTSVPQNATGWLAVEFGNWTSRQLDSNTWLNHTRVRAEGRDWLLIYYVKYINGSHRLYVVTLAEIEGGGYGRVFTWANYWFKNKTVYFGDWVVVEGNFTLSQYYALLSTAVDRLAREWQASDRQYKPQAYPQISQALMQISRAVAGTDIDAALKKGYALVTDIKPIVVAGIIAGVWFGYLAAKSIYDRTGDLRRAVICGAWVGVHSFVATIIPLTSWAGVGLFTYVTLRAGAPSLIGVC